MECERVPSRGLDRLDPRCEGDSRGLTSGQTFKTVLGESDQGHNTIKKFDG